MNYRRNFTKKCLSGVAGVLVAATVLLGGCSNSQAGQQQESGNGIPAAVASSEVSDARNTPVVRAAKAVGPAVVGITNKAVARDWFNNPVQVEGAGSGVIFRKDGYIVTNNHVISGAKEIIVSLSDGRSLSGKLVGADELTDLAVVKVDANDLPAAEFGNSDDIMVGEPAIAIGNPMGLEFQGSVTSGVISALNRSLELDDRVIKVIQTDAAINPGNSGGALVNADGKVIGINSAKIARSGVEGMGFAIPINTVREIVDDLMDDGKVTRPYLGVGIFDKETAGRYGYILNVDKGVYVENVTVNGPAYKAGIRRGDVILSVGDKETNRVGDVRNAVLAAKVGDTVKVKLDRDGSTVTVDVVMEAAS
ncbi:MAG: trypsin-like peptidase domain-containing protein [Selenomonadaceae bacterium]|uniref:S1C family serine protease n=1 Tax=Anaerovibrio slackiae TaxID=2652309 RepID=UPI0038662F9C|nr:trypsin-like peptidase domain-containing protein [Selenomonadaceae bacterium]